MNLFNLTHVGYTHNKAVELINKITPSLLENIKYEIKDNIPYEAVKTGHEQGVEYHQIAGFYCYEKKHVCLCDRSTLKTALHEIGHAVHHQLFNFEKLTFSTEGKSERAKLNYLEDFAEAFAAFFINSEKSNSFSKRDFEIKSLLNNY